MFEQKKKIPYENSFTAINLLIININIDAYYNICTKYCAKIIWSITSVIIIFFSNVCKKDILKSIIKSHKKK